MDEAIKGIEFDYLGRYMSRVDIIQKNIIDCLE